MNYYMVSVKAHPFVSCFRSKTAIPDENITISNKTIDKIWWQACKRATATRGQSMPPILPTELAVPKPVVLTDVGYTYRKQNAITPVSNKNNTVGANLERH